VSERALWTANDDGLTTAYQLWKSPDNIAPFVLVTTIVHNKADLSVYLPETNQFFFDDVGGLDTDYYKVRATDGVNFSPFSAARRPDPVRPPTCIVYGKLLDLDGVPMEGVEILFHVVTTEKFKSGQFVGNTEVNAAETPAFADADGDWEIELMQGADVQINIPASNLVKRFIVPATDTAALVTLI
jgi:hypothetical protein